ncbi:MAG TPA: MlaD family protein [Longimicrobium sp.]|nr:MlaD family protein [Longimicrobium sp.]
MAPIRTPRREVHVGLFVVLGVLAVLVALFALTDPGTFRGRYYVSTVVQNAGGIRKGDPVQLKGVNVGRVHDFAIDRTGGVRITMELQHDPEYEVPADSKVSIVSGGLLQSMIAEIVPGRSQEELQDGAVLPAVEAQSLTGTVETLSAGADTVLVRAQQLLSQQNIGAVGASAQQMQELLVLLTALAADQRTQLNTLTASLGRSAQGLEGTVSAVNQPELARAIARTDSMTIRLDAATGSLQQASASLATLVQRVDSGEGTLGKLTRDDELYQNMNAAVESLNQLTTDIRTNPRKYINVSVF